MFPTLSFTNSYWNSDSSPIVEDGWNKIPGITVAQQWYGLRNWLPILDNMGDESQERGKKKGGWEIMEDGGLLEFQNKVTLLRMGRLEGIQRRKMFICVDINIKRTKYIQFIYVIIVKQTTINR